MRTTQIDLVRTNARGFLHQVWVHVVESQEEVEPYLDAIAGCYRTVFGTYPYDEVYSDTDIEQITKPAFRRFAHHGVLLLLMTGTDREKSQLIGFGGCEGADACEAAVFLQQHEHRLDAPLKNYLYMAELGVLPEFRQQGFGVGLIRMRIEEATSRHDGRFTHLIMRTAREGSHSAGLYRKLGCTEIAGVVEPKTVSTRAARSEFSSRCPSFIDK